MSVRGFDYRQHCYTYRPKVPILEKIPDEVSFYAAAKVQNNEIKIIYVNFPAELSIRIM